ncbi:MAG: 30S ribosomal protein S6 [Nitrospirales bacterium]|nr:30S ribosomal protein S6 [Nitrospirales bacterium]
MPLYESIVILRPSLSDEETTAIIEKTKERLEKEGASILKADNWGKKKLAYEIQHDRRGTYVQFQFDAGGQVIGQLERFYKLEDSIMKFLTIRMEPEDLQPVAVDEPAESDDAGIQ